MSDIKSEQVENIVQKTGLFNDATGSLSSKRVTSFICMGFAMAIAIVAMVKGTQIDVNACGLWLGGAFIAQGLTLARSF